MSGEMGASPACLQVDYPAVIRFNNRSEFIPAISITAWIFEIFKVQFFLDPKTDEMMWF